MTVTVTWSDVAWVAAGGVVGTAARAGVLVLLPISSAALPWPTLAVNIVGSLALGLLIGYLGTRGLDPGWHRRIRLGLGVGLLGSFTTYSAFVAEIYALQDAGVPVLALGYAAMSIVIGIAAAALGLWWAGLRWGT